MLTMLEINQVIDIYFILTLLLKVVHDSRVKRWGGGEVTLGNISVISPVEGTTALPVGQQQPERGI